MEEAWIAQEKEQDGCCHRLLAQAQVGGGRDSFIQGQPREDCLAGWPSLGQATRGGDFLWFPPP